MTANVAVFCDLTRGYFVKGKSDSTVTNQPFGQFFSKNNLNLVVYPLVLAPDGTSLVKYSAVNVSGLSLSAAIYNSTGSTKLAEGTVFTTSVDEKSLTGALNCDTVEMAAAVTSDSATVIIEFRFSGTFGTRTVRASAATILKQYNSTGTPAPVANETYPTTSEMNARCVLREMENGGAITLTSPDGTKKIILYVDNDGTFKQDPIS